MRPVLAYQCPKCAEWSEIDDEPTLKKARALTPITLRCEACGHHWQRAPGNAVWTVKSDMEWMSRRSE